jgi:predicted amidohydrolase YtcJ
MIKIQTAGSWNKITVAQAIQYYTINNATPHSKKSRRGSIEAGKFADLVLLNEDILSIDPVKIRDVRVLMTVLGGKVIYEQK